MKITYFFNAIERKKLIMIMLGIIMMGFVEMVGIATILPFLAVVTRPEVVQTNIYLSSLYHLFGFASDKMFILFLGGVVFTVLVGGNTFAALMTWLILRFCFRQGKKISCTLFTKYLSQPYIFYLNRHSSDLAKNILSEVERLVTGIFINSIQLITKFVLMISIFSLLLIVDPLLATAVIVILGGSYIIIYSMVRKKLICAGKTASAENTIRYQLLLEVMAAIKEIKVIGQEKKFLDDFSASTQKYIQAETISQLSPSITKYVIEIIAFGGMVLIALYLIGTKEDISQFLPLLGLYALAGYRLMPAMQHIFTGLSSLKYHHCALDIVYQEMQLPQQPLMNATTPLPLEKQLQLKQVCFNYPNSQKIALNDISINISRHTTVGIVGTSGAGKTTLVDIILGLLVPTQGQVVVDDVAVDQKKIQHWQRNIGYVPQNIALLDTTVMNNIALGVKPEDIDQSAVERAASIANLHHFITEELPEGYQTAIGERGVRLSGGQRQRIGIARAIYHNPELLIFDEATSALDGSTEKVIMEAIKSLAHQKTIILIAHRLNTVKDCDLIYVLNKGEIVGQGTYHELYMSNQSFQNLANAHINV